MFKDQDQDQDQDQDSKVRIGDVVAVNGYGGYAKVINMEVDGITPQGYTKWLCTVVFGPYNTTAGVTSRSKHLHQFHAGKLTRINKNGQPIKQKGQKAEPNIDTMTREQILARIAEINAKLGV